MKTETVKKMIALLTDATKKGLVKWERDNKPSCYTMLLARGTTTSRFTVHTKGNITVVDTIRNWAVVPDTNDYKDDLTELVVILEDTVDQRELEAVVHNLEVLVKSKERRV